MHAAATGVDRGQRDPEGATRTILLMTIHDICVPAVTVSHRGMPVSEAARVMEQRHVGCVIVVEERESGKRPVGMLTDRDIVLGVVARARDPRGVPVGEVMTPDVCAVRDDASVKDALVLMRRRGVRRAPVVDARGMLVGIVTLDDLLRLVAGQLNDLAATVSQELALEPFAR
jgi:CBS domain-containing protein